MKYTVVSTPFADYQLAEIWMRASNRQQVTNASDQISSALRHDPDRIGVLRSDGRRVVILAPLIFTFEVSEADRLVTIVSIRLDPLLEKP